jgi:hypothetical protein
MTVLNTIKARLLLDWVDSPGNKGSKLGYAIARRAAQDIGVCEDPPGSNRSLQIDEYNVLAGSPLGSFWCATAVGCWYRLSGARVPPAYGNCDQWLTYGIKWNCLQDIPLIGSIALYGTPTDIIHVGIIVRTYPYTMAIEGNTTLEGFSRNGEIVTMKKPRANVVKYFYPSPELGQGSG